ncbi:hypothetical protein SUGI_0132400 [Cryptomeria japonica]|nr:hypothetical protein SUGI_0132400 [Cryptomeria japonica]
MSAPRRPQQNGVVERRNRTLIDCARTLIIEKDIPHVFWREVVSTIVCYIKRDEYSGKFDPKSDEGTFLDYSTKSKSYQCLNKRIEDYQGFKYTVPVEPAKENPVVAANEEVCEVEPVQPIEEALRNEPVLAMYVRNNHSVDNIIGDKDVEVLTRRRARENTCFLSKIEPKTTKEALKDEVWIKAMEEELEQIEKNESWTLVLRPKNKNVIGTKWVFRNKMDETGQVVRNKARLEGVKTLLAYVAYKKFKVYQTDVKSTFLNVVLEEDVYIEQPEGFASEDGKDMVCKLKNALYEIFVDDIIFGGHDEMSKGFADEMK